MNTYIMLEALRHPHDHVDTKKLKDSKLIRLLWKIYAKLFANDNYIDLLLRFGGIKADPEIFPEHYKAMEDVCNSLHMPIPELFFVTYTSSAESFLSNGKQYIVLNSCAYSDKLQYEVEIVRQCFNLMLVPEECKSMTSFLLKILSKSSNFPLPIIVKLVSSIYASIRRSTELSVDRAAVLYFHSEKKFLAYLLNTMWLSMNDVTDAGYRQMVEMLLNSPDIDDKNSRLCQNMLIKSQVVDEYMPATGLRATEIAKWVAGDEYKKLICCLDTPEEAKEWPLPVSSKDARKMDPDSLKELFTNSNFTNVTCKATSNAVGIVVSVSADGNTEFECAQWCDKDAPIIIYVR